MKSLGLLSGLIGLSVLGGCAAVPGPKPAQTASVAPVTPTKVANNDATPSPCDSPGSLADDHCVATSPGSLSTQSIFEVLHLPLTLDQQQAVHKASVQAQGLWEVIRADFGMPLDTNHTRVQQAIDMYARYPQFLTQVSARAKPYLQYIVDQLQQRKMPLALALLPIVESGYDPYAYSYSGAVGLWQFTAGTARVFDVHINWWYDGRRSLYASTRAALDYLDQLHQQFGTWPLALAAYNSGSGTVQWAIQRNKALGRPTDFWALPLPAQTRFYVPKLVALMAIVADPKRYNVKLVPIQNKPTLKMVPLHHQIELDLAARLSHVPLDQLRALNPGYSRWATPPNGEYHLALPKEQAAVFEENLKTTPEAKRVTWIRRRVHTGDTLGGFALNYGTTVAVLRRINGLSGNLIRVGQELVLPRGGGANVASPDEAVQVQRPNEYRVRNGDSLWTVARRYGVSVGELRSWNHLSPGQVLSVGTVLALRSNAVPPARQTASVAASGTWNNITVTQGDTLSGLAQKYHTTYTALAKWNDMSPSQTLSPGMTLAVLTQPIDGAASSATANDSQSTQAATPPPGFKLVQVQSGDSLWLIANRYGVTVEQLAKWNGLTVDSVLRPGMSLMLREQSASAQLSAVSQVQVQQPSTPQPQMSSTSSGHTVTVHAGDSLWTIAMSNHITLARLERLNGLSSSSVLRPGMQLLV